jgi:hypothetical protein
MFEPGLCILARNRLCIEIFTKTFARRQQIFAAIWAISADLFEAAQAIKGSGLFLSLSTE